ncbi:hypothetical protein [Rhodanobacter aciditrophus]|uniref:hypothetical protein n=1 Tax=Rhodanobacter aciditrophus TaxID=1623218 RepID=UPI003CF64B0C
MPSKKVAPVMPKSRSLAVEAEPGEARDHALARVAISPHLGAARTIVRYAKADLGELCLTELTHVLKEQAAALNDGDLSQVEAVLSNQATTLDVMFAELAHRAAMNMGEHLEATETYLRLAMRAQNQCRATLETLAAIKNPPVVFAKQANIAHGHQQVNNGTAVAHAKQSERARTELLEHDHGKRLDTRASAKAGRGDPPVAAVVEIHRATKRRGQGRIKP